MEAEKIAQVCHEANRAYCATIGDLSQPEWNAAPEWQRQSAINGVKYRLDNPGATSESMHENWCKDKTADGWVYGEKKDPEKKTHHCLVPYGDLPVEQRRKDALFSAVVDALTGTD